MTFCLGCYFYTVWKIDMPDIDVTKCNLQYRVVRLLVIRFSTKTGFSANI